MVDYEYIKKNILSISKFDKHISGTFNNEGIVYDSESGSITIYFTSELSTGDKITLDSLVESYNNQEGIINYIQRYINTAIINVEEEEWTLVVSWIETGNEQLCELLVESKLLPATPDDSLNVGFEYYIRVLDVTNNIVLGQSTLSNKEYTSSVLALTNFSGTQSTLEFQVKKSTKGSRTSVTNITCNYK